MADPLEQAEVAYDRQKAMAGLIELYKRSKADLTNTSSRIQEMLTTGNRLKESAPLTPEQIEAIDNLLAFGGVLSDLVLAVLDKAKINRRRATAILTQAKDAINNIGA